ncbi:unnamed protein product [Rotaria socialis]
MTEKIRRSRVQISQGWCLYAVLGKFSLSKSKNYSFLEFLVNIYIEFSIVSSKRIVTLFQLWKSRVAFALTLYCGPRSLEMFRLWVSGSYFELSDVFHNARQRLLSIGNCNVLISSFFKQSFQTKYRM